MSAGLLDGCSVSAFSASLEDAVARGSVEEAPAGAAVRGGVPSGERPERRPGGVAGDDRSSRSAPRKNASMCSPVVRAYGERCKMRVRTALGGDGRNP